MTCIVSVRSDSLPIREVFATARIFSFFPLIYMPNGTIKKKMEKGFGFIAMEGGADVFFHLSACNGQFDSLQEGQSVTFDLVNGEKGPKAENVVAA